jgi:hypothetical protein
MERMLQAAQNTGDATLNWYYQKQMMLDSLLEKREREQLVNDVAHEVLSRLSATVDVSEIINEIDELRRALEKFYDDYK